MVTNHEKVHDVLGHLCRDKFLMISNSNAPIKKGLLIKKLPQIPSNKHLVKFAIHLEIVLFGYARPVMFNSKRSKRSDFLLYPTFTRTIVERINNAGFTPVSSMT